MDVIWHYGRGQRVVFLKEPGQQRVLRVYPIIASHDIVTCVVFCKQAVVGESVRTGQRRVFQQCLRRRGESGRLYDVVWKGLTVGRVQDHSVGEQGRKIAVTES